MIIDRVQRWLDQHALPEPHPARGNILPPGMEMFAGLSNPAPQAKHLRGRGLGVSTWNGNVPQYLRQISLDCNSSGAVTLYPFTPTPGAFRR